jgi:5'-phosphate synthase pdxT subunit
VKIGILALQGGFLEHAAALNKLGVESFEIRQKADLDEGPDGLILPGGESTVIRRLLGETGLYGPLGALIGGGLPVFGTCAGMILLAEEIENEPSCFGAIGITVRRNAYGRQLGSFRTAGDFAGLGEIPMTFIRAPYIASAGGGASILASVDGAGVAAEQGAILVTAFHPELTDDLRVHAYFLSKIKNVPVN